MKRLDVTWPVALDDDMTIWNAFGNQYWPADYVADRHGPDSLHALRRGRLHRTPRTCIRKLLGVPATSPPCRAGHQRRDRLGVEHQSRDVSRTCSTRTRRSR